MLDADVDPSLLLRDLDEPEYLFWRAAIIAEARDDSARSFAAHLSAESTYWLPEKLGFARDDPQHIRRSRGTGNTAKIWKLPSRN